MRKQNCSIRFDHDIVTFDHFRVPTCTILLIENDATRYGPLRCACTPCTPLHRILCSRQCRKCRAPAPSAPLPALTRARSALRPAPRLRSFFLFFYLCFIYSLFMFYLFFIYSLFIFYLFFICFLFFIYFCFYLLLFSIYFC